MIALLLITLMGQDYDLRDYYETEYTYRSMTGQEEIYFFDCDKRVRLKYKNNVTKLIVECPNYIYIGPLKLDGTKYRK